MENASWLSPDVSLDGWGVAFLTALVSLIIFFVRYLKSRIPTRIAEINALGERQLKELLVGKWFGNAVEATPTGVSGRTYAVEWDFRLAGGELVCDSPASYIENGRHERDEYHLTCKIMYGRFVLVEYYNRDRNQINFGTEMLQIHDSGVEFCGNFVGYSSYTGGIISGEISGYRDRLRADREAPGD